MNQPTLILMPAMSDDATSATLEVWTVQIGQFVKAGSTVCEVSIDKVDTEVPSPVDGYVTRFLVRAGTEGVTVGQPLLEISPVLPETLKLEDFHRGTPRARTPLVIPTVKLDPAAQAPSRGSDLAAGWDLYAAEALTLASGRWGTVRTGLSIALPAGHEMQIRPRSGLAFKHGVTVLNAPGTIDADYRGELKILLINHGERDFEIQPGDRIAQAVVARHEPLRFVFTDQLPDTERGAGGFGHTGK